MANNPKATTEGKLIIVDPNPADNQIVPPEELNIYVELNTVQRSRSILSASLDGKEIASTNIDNVGNRSGTIRFIDGTDIGDEKFLTTHFTEIGTTFGDNADTLETLGIKNIDIQFNSAYAPLIKIDFVDIRGRIFEQQSDFSNERTDKDPRFSVFFKFPYPVFQLTVKGFYGHAVTYCLHLVDFSAKFNDATGNFEITCQFIGYTYAYLTDMLMGIVRAIGNTAIGSQKLAEKRRETRNPLTGFECIPIDELNTKILSLNERITKLKVRDTGLTALIEAEKLITDLSIFKEEYGEKLKTASTKIGKNEITSNDSGFVLMGNPTNTTINEAINFIKVFLNDKFTPLAKRLGERYKIDANTLELVKGSNLFTSIFKSSFLRPSNDIGTDTPKDLPAKVLKIDNGIYNRIQVGVNQDLAPGRISAIDNTDGFDQINRIITEIEKDLKKTRETVADKIKEIAKEELGFVPTIRNYLNIMTCHIEVLMDTIKDVAVEAEKGRSGSATLAEFRRLQGNIDKVGGETSKNIFPFPTYKERKGITSPFEDAWIGNKFPDLPESRFIIDLLDGLISSRRKDNEFQSALNRGVVQWMPVSPFDTTLVTNRDNPWTVSKNFLNDTDIIRMMVERGMIFLAHTNTNLTNSEIKSMARIEANNAFNNLENDFIITTLSNYRNATDRATAINNVLVDIKNLRGGLGVFENKRDLVDTTFFSKDNFGLVREIDGQTEFVHIYSDAAIVDEMENKGLLTDLSGNKSTDADFSGILDKKSDYGRRVSYIPLYPTYEGDRFIYDSFSRTEPTFPAQALPMLRSLRDENNEIFLSSQWGVNNSLASQDDGGTYLKILDDDVYRSVGAYPDYVETILSEEGLSAIDNIFSSEQSIIDASQPDANNKLEYNPFGGVLRSQEYVNYVNNTGEVDEIYELFYYENLVTKDTSVVIDSNGAIDEITDNFVLSGPRLLNSSQINTFDLDGNNPRGILSSTSLNNPHSTKYELINKRKRKGQSRLLIKENRLTGNISSTPFFNFSVENAKNINNVDIPKVFSLIGSEWYYSQDSDEAKSFMFLSTLPFLGTNDEGPSALFRGLFKDNDLIHGLFNQRGGFVKVPNAWALFLGALIYRREVGAGFISAGDVPTFTYSSSREETADTNLDIIKFSATTSDGNVSLIPGTVLGPDPVTNLNHLEDLIFLNRKPFTSSFESTEPISQCYLRHREGNGIAFQLHTRLVRQGKATNGQLPIEQIINLLPWQAKKEFMDLYTDWVSDTNGWLAIKEELELFVLGTTSEQIRDFWDNMSNTDSMGREVLDVDFIKNSSIVKPSTFENYIVFTKDSEDSNTKNFFLEIKDGSILNSKVLELLDGKNIIANASWRNFTDAALDDNFVSEAATFNALRVNTVKFDLYVQSFMNEFIDLNAGNEFRNSTKDIKNQIFNTVDNEDIKINLYKTIKNIYDKWVAGVDSAVNVCTPKRDNLIDTFEFFDRGYNDIGDKFLINPIAVTEFLISDYNKDFYSFLSRLLADNNFDFIPLPVWVNFKSPSELLSVFRTHRWNDAENFEDAGPRFVCMYIGERSSSLDLPDDTYENDAVDFTLPGIPFDFVNSDPAEEDPKNIPAFLVNYGDQNQSIFKNFKLDQKEFTETFESLITTDEISKLGSPTNRTYAGQNLYNVYQKRSYSCEVEMLGNMIIQPFMYFQLNNIPMFHGVYTIIKVQHTIKPNHASTKFKGVRIRSTKTKLVDETTLYMNLIGSINLDEFSDGDVSNLESTSFDDGTTSLNSGDTIQISIT